MNGTHRPRLTWTTRQREVLDLLAQGRTNAEIGERLGISLDGAKWHVSEILAHLGVSSREDAAAYWRTERRPMRRLARFGTGLISTLAGAGKAVTIGGGLVVTAGLAAGVLFLASRDNPNEPASPTPSETPSTPSATVQPSPAAQAPIYECPVDQETCDFALEQERNLQARDISALLDPSPWQRSGSQSSFIEWLDTTFPTGGPGPRLVSIGCPMSDDRTSSCDTAFALTFSTISSRELTGSGPGLANFLYQRADNGDHELRTTVNPEGPDRIYSLEGVPGSLACYDFQVPTKLPSCVQVAWYTAKRTAPVNPADTLQGVPVTELRLGEPWDLPAGLRVFATRLYYATDAGFNEGQRRFVSIAGELRIDDPFANFRKATGIDAPPSSWRGDDRMETIVAVSLPTTRAGRALRSDDGGQTWRIVAENLPKGTGVAGMLAGETLMVTQAGGSAAPTQARFWILESGETIVPPADTATHVVVDGRLYWSVGIGSFKRLVDREGNTVAQPDLQGINSYLLFPDRFESGDWLTGWSAAGASFIGRHSPEGVIEEAWTWTESEVLWPKAVIGEDLVLANALPVPGADGRSLNLGIAIVDLRNGVVHFLPALSEGRTDNLSPFIDGVVVSETMLVDAGGECLNLRSEPRLDAPLVACIPDGMLVDDLRRQQPPVVEGGIGGREWNAVRAAGYGTGWVAAEFVTR